MRPLLLAAAGALVTTAAGSTEESCAAAEVADESAAMLQVHQATVDLEEGPKGVASPWFHRRPAGPPKLRNVAIAFDHLSTTAVSLGASPGSAFSTAAADAKAESKWPGQFGKPGDDKQSGAMWPGQPAGKGDKGDKAAKSDKAPAPFQIVHFEAVQRKQDDHVVYMARPIETEGKLEVLVAQMASRSKAGPLGSNFQTREVSEGHTERVAPQSDAVVKTLRFAAGESAGIWRVAGMSSYGDDLAVGADAFCTPLQRMLDAKGCNASSSIHFFDTTNPLAPTKSAYTLDRGTQETSSMALIGEEDGGLLLLAIAPDAVVDVYRSPPARRQRARQLNFERVASWKQEPNVVAAGEQIMAYQSLSLVRQQDGQLFMLGSVRYMAIGKNVVDLVHVDVAGGTVSLKKVKSQAFSCAEFPCSFFAPAGAYVADEDTLAMYAASVSPDLAQIYINEFGRNTTSK